ncbi:MAG: putative metal-binding motif-containing protein [Myxococcales bacterium]|nr:putative metal-binding motif-containing protein [Myxococcales bacterium]
MGKSGLLGLGAVCSLGLGLLVACGGGDTGTGLPGIGGAAGSGTGGTGVGGGSSGGSAGVAGSATGGAGGAGGAAGSGAVGGGGTGGAPACNSGPNDDQDKDGFTVAEGDCDDCDPKVNPGAIEVATPSGETAKDDDCNGTVDDVPATCDDAVALDEKDPVTVAKSIELCKAATGAKDWGLVSAKWVLPDGTAVATANETNYHLGHGALPAFGTNGKVQNGKRLLGLSSGTARQPSDPGYQAPSGFSKGYTSGSPTGFPKESPACPNVTTGAPNDGVALEVEVRVPTNAVAFSFDSNFYTYEWPTYVCSQYNDFFLALMSPVPSGLTDANVVYDSANNLISVNSALLDVCSCASGPPCTAGSKSYSCAQGGSLLLGTGFGKDTANGEDHGATGWLVTTVPVTGGSTVTMRFTVYDSGDGVYDSTTLLDNWTWLTSGAPTAPTTKAKP